MDLSNQNIVSVSQMSPLKLLLQHKIGDFLNLLPISRENLRKTDPCLGSFASQRDPSERHIGNMVDTGSAPPPGYGGPVTKNDDTRRKTAFATHSGLLQCTVILFAL